MITGGASGMGLLSGQKLAEAGANVVLCDVNREALEKAIDSANDTMIRSILERFTEQTAPNTARLKELSGDLEMFRTLPEYTALATEPRDFLESRLFENLLEYAVYLLNESKGVAGYREAVE